MLTLVQITMVVKEKIGRRRYIVFHIDTIATIDKKSLIYTINNRFNGSEVFRTTPWVIFIRNNYGLVRCHHLDSKKTIELLGSIRQIVGVNQPVKIKTLGTTGTIKSARKKYLDKYFLYPLNNYTN